VAGSLRPASRRSRARYVLADSEASAAGSSRWRGLADRLPHWGGSDKQAALETRADPVAADDSATDEPELDDAKLDDPRRDDAKWDESKREEPKLEEPGREEGERSGPEAGAPPREPPPGKADADQPEKAPEEKAGAPAPRARREAEDGRGPEHGREQAGERGRPRLRPVPDLADYVRDHIQPLLRALEGRYEAELQPIKHDRVALIVRVYGRRSRLHFYTAWDGERPLVLACRLFIAEHDHKEWWPGDDEERYDLPHTLSWGLRLLDLAP
jgi:hypothetical protein